MHPFRDQEFGRRDFYAALIVGDRRWSGCPDSNWGPHGPKPCALPTALHPVDPILPWMARLGQRLIAGCGSGLPELPRTLVQT